MPNILDAYSRAKEMGRKADRLFVSYDLNLDRRTKTVVVKGEVSGGSEPHMATITWPVKNDWLVTPLRTLKTDNNALYHCDCQDFRFTFYPHLEKMGETLETFPPYVPNGRGLPRAIDGYGMCKHVVALFNALKADGKIVNRK